MLRAKNEFNGANSPHFYLLSIAKNSSFSKIIAQERLRNYLRNQKLPWDKRLFDQCCRYVSWRTLLTNTCRSCLHFMKNLSTEVENNHYKGTNTVCYPQGIFTILINVFRLLFMGKVFPWRELSRGFLKENSDLCCDML